MSFGLAIGPISLPTQSRKLLGELFRIGAGRSRLLQHDERAHGFAGQLVGTADDGGFGNHRIGDQRRFDLHRAQAVAGDVEHVVDAAHDGEIAGLLVAHRAVAGEVKLAAELFRDSTTSCSAPDRPRSCVSSPATAA